MLENKKGTFKLIKKSLFKDLEEDAVLPESDLCFQNDDAILQFMYIEPENGIENKVVIEPGIFTLSESQAGIVPIVTELRLPNLLETVDNTSAIMNEANVFFDKLDVYEKLGKQKKRGVLLYSRPGMGKSSAISKTCIDFVKEDSGTVVINWPTSEIHAESVAKLFSMRSKFSDKCTRMLLIIEDIGGGEEEGSIRNGVTSGLLNLLDGINVTFKLPTFILATTNHPENLLSALADRPGRFDLMLELQPPKYEEKIALTEFIAKRLLTNEEKKAFKLKGAEDFSVAHLEEIIIRSMLHNKTIPIVVKELINHTKKYKKDFVKPSKGMGFNTHNDWD